MKLIQGIVRIGVLLVALVVALPLAFIRMIGVNAMVISDGIIQETYPRNKKNENLYENDNNKKN